MSPFAWLLGGAAERIDKLICQLAGECVAAKGKRKEKKGRWERERENILKSLRSMVDSLAERVESPRPSQTAVEAAIEEALSASFERYGAQPTQIKGERSVSKRGSKTIVFPCSDADGYVRLVNYGKRFKSEVVEKLPELGRGLGHNPGCKGGEGYCMKGFRRIPRKTAMPGGKRKTFPIRMARCLGCRERFSVFPSFLPREKTFRDSFEKFVERIDFKVCGVTKDKWKASTNALKSVFHGIWNRSYECT